MPKLGERLKKVALRLQTTVAPAVGDDIVEVWRPRGGTVSGGVGINDAGEPVRTGGGVTTGAAWNAVYYARLSHDTGGSEPDVTGPPLSVLPFSFNFNAGDAPGIRGNDFLLLGAKRSISQTIAELGWRAQTEYATGAVEQPTGHSEYYAVATTSGTSGSTEPAWTQTTGTLVSDGAMLWRMVKKRRFGVIDPGGAQTFDVVREVLAQEVK